MCDGALPRFRNKPLVVTVGGGDSAVEEADYLAKYSPSTVYLIHRRDELRASKIMAERAQNNPKIDILWNTQVAEVLGNDEVGMTGVRLASTVGEPDREVEATGMFVAIGHTPNTKFLAGQLDMNDKGLPHVDRAVPHEHERRGRFRRGRRVGRLLPPSLHRRRDRLHGGARRGAMAGGPGLVSGKACERGGREMRGWMEIWGCRLRVAASDG